MLEANGQKTDNSEAIRMNDMGINGGVVPVEGPVSVQVSEEDEKPDTRPVATTANENSSSFSSVVNYVNHEITADPYDVLKTDTKINAIHQGLKRHEVRVEELFKYVQVFTAIVASFTHGNVTRLNDKFFLRRLALLSSRQNSC